MGLIRNTLSTGANLSGGAGLHCLDSSYDIRIRCLTSLPYFAIVWTVAPPVAPCTALTVASAAASAVLVTGAGVTVFIISAIAVFSAAYLVAGVITCVAVLSGCCAVAVLGALDALEQWC